MDTRLYINLMENIPSILILSFFLFLIISYSFLFINKKQIQVKNKLEDYKLIYEYNNELINNNYDIFIIEEKIKKQPLLSYSFMNMKNIKLLQEKNINNDLILDYINNVNNDIKLLANSIENNKIANKEVFDTIYNSLFDSMMHNYFKILDINTK